MSVNKSKKTAGNVKKKSGLKDTASLKKGSSLSSSTSKQLNHKTPSGKNNAGKKSSATVTKKTVSSKGVASKDIIAKSIPQKNKNNSAKSALNAKSKSQNQVSLKKDSDEKKISGHTQVRKAHSGKNKQSKKHDATSTNGPAKGKLPVQKARVHKSIMKKPIVKTTVAETNAVKKVTLAKGVVAKKMVEQKRATPVVKSKPVLQQDKQKNENGGAIDTKNSSKKAGSKTPFKSQRDNIPEAIKHKEQNNADSSKMTKSVNIPKTAESKKSEKAIATLNLAKIKSQLEGDALTDVSAMVQDDLSLVVKDPNWIFAHWYISPETVKTLQKVYPRDKIDNAKLAIYLYDFNENDALPKEKRLLNVYYPGIGSHFHHLHVPLFFGKRVYIDLGFETDEKKFIHLSRSNLVYIPHSKYTAKHSTQYITFSHLKKHMESYNLDYKTSGFNMENQKINSGDFHSSENLHSNLSSMNVSSAQFSSGQLGSHVSSHGKYESSFSPLKSDVHMSESSFLNSMSSESRLSALEANQTFKGGDSSAFTGFENKALSSHQVFESQVLSSGILAGSSEQHAHTWRASEAKKMGASESVFENTVLMGGESSHGLSSGNLFSESVWSKIGQYSSETSSFQTSSFQESSNMMSSFAISSFAGPDDSKNAPVQWQSEVTFTGRTQKDSKIYIEGREIAVQSDGTFIMRLPEHLAKKNVKIDIVHADGKTEKWVGAFSGQIKPV